MAVIVIPGSNRSTEEMTAKFNWCQDTLGKFRGRWNYDIARDVFGFQEESDAVLFQLKWCRNGQQSVV